jgi:hypothetical protein
VSCLNLVNFEEVSQFQVEGECFLPFSLDLKSNQTLRVNIRVVLVH